MKRINKPIGKIFRAVFGMSGGFVVAVAISLFLFHLKYHFGFPIPSLVKLCPVLTILLMLIGAKFSGYFSNFGLLIPMVMCPYDGVTDVTRKEGLIRAGFLLGFIALIGGVVCSYSSLTFLGIGGVVLFAFSVARNKNGGGSTGES